MVFETWSLVRSVCQLRSVPRAVATGSQYRRSRPSRGLYPVATARGTDLVGTVHLTLLHIRADFSLSRARWPPRSNTRRRRSRPTVARQLTRPPCRLRLRPTADLP